MLIQMAKNNVRSAASPGSAESEPEVIVGGGIIEEAVKRAEEVMAEGMKQDSVSALPDAPAIGVRLHEEQGRTVAGQIAAMSAMRTAYQCVYGKNMTKKDLTAWSEGGIILPAEKRDADILVRICYALGVLTEIVAGGE